MTQVDVNMEEQLKQNDSPLIYSFSNPLSSWMDVVSTSGGT
uniref:Uncharacterized protein n=1 Tax=Anguilla anguilla TaxID=7936 RepID=A0A0E9TL44_ANGAN